MNKEELVEIIKSLNLKILNVKCEDSYLMNKFTLEELKYIIDYYTVKLKTDNYVMMTDVRDSKSITLEEIEHEFKDYIVIDDRKLVPEDQLTNIAVTEDNRTVKSIRDVVPGSYVELSNGKITRIKSIGVSKHTPVTKIVNRVNLNCYRGDGEYD